MIIDEDLKPILSVIMPSLNVGRYIAECLESVVRQTLENIEIIVVDAGSADDTLRIVMSYAAEDKRIRIVHSDKKSYGYQLNLGISKASGRYIGIVETDDYIEPNMYESLVRVALEEDADYVKGNAEMFLLRNGLLVTREITSYPKDKAQGMVAVNPSQNPHLWFDDPFVWTGIYRRAFVCQYAFRETPGAAFQDISFLFRIIRNANKGVYVPKIFYHYRQDNAAASSYNDKSMDYVRSEYSYIKDMYTNLAPEWIYIYYRRMAMHALNRINFMVYGGRFWDGAQSSIEWLQKELFHAIDQGILTHDSYERREEWEDVLMFLENPREIFDTRLADFRRRQQEKKHLAESLYRKDGWIILGAGEKAERMLRGMLLYGLKVCALCSIDSSLWGKKILGVEIVPLHVAGDKHPEASCMMDDTGQVDAEAIGRKIDIHKAVSAADSAISLARTDIRLFTADF